MVALLDSLRWGRLFSANEIDSKAPASLTAKTNQNDRKEKQEKQQQLSFCTRQTQSFSFRLVFYQRNKLLVLKHSNRQQTAHTHIAKGVSHQPHNVGNSVASVNYNIKMRNKILLMVQLR